MTYNIVNRGPDRLSTYGDGDNAAATGSFAAAVEPGTLSERWRRADQHRKSPMNGTETTHYSKERPPPKP